MKKHDPNFRIDLMYRSAQLVDVKTGELVTDARHCGDYGNVLRTFEPLIKENSSVLIRRYNKQSLSDARRNLMNETYIYSFVFKFDLYEYCDPAFADVDYNFVNRP